jgi:hypothetical protein
MDLASCIFLVVREVRITWKRKKILLRIFYSTIKIHFSADLCRRQRLLHAEISGLKGEKSGKIQIPIRL